MKKMLLIYLIGILCNLCGCSMDENIMKPGTSTSRETFNEITQSLSGTISGLNIKLGSESDSETWNTVKGYAQQYYNDTLSGYTNSAKNYLSGFSNEIKSQYNSGVDRLSDEVANTVNSAIKEKLDTIKMK